MNTLDELNHLLALVDEALADQGNDHDTNEHRQGFREAMFQMMGWLHSSSKRLESEVDMDPGDKFRREIAELSAMVHRLRDDSIPLTKFTLAEHETMHDPELQFLGCHFCEKRD